MKCFIYDEKKNSNYDIDKFLGNSILQVNYKLHSIYEAMKNYNYNYIVCVENDLVVGVMPFIIYKNEFSNIINSMPLIGYGGIEAIKENKNKIFEKVIEYLNKVAEENNVNLITICTQPFKDDEYSLYKNIFKPDFERKNFYQYLDLEKDIFENMKSKFRGNLKRNIKKCIEKYNIDIVESYDLKDLEYWYENVYKKRLKETGCVIYPYKVFETFLTNIKKEKIKMLYGISEGKIIAGGLYLNQGKSMDNFMRVVDSNYFNTQVGTYMDYLSIKYSIDNKFQYYNWQSCDDIGSSIFKYKEDWGSEIGYHYYLTKVVGDIEDLKNMPIKKIKNNFSGIYVLPYEEFKNK